MYIRILLELAS